MTTLAITNKAKVLEDSYVVSYHVVPAREAHTIADTF